MVPASFLDFSSSLVSLSLIPACLLSLFSSSSISFLHSSGLNPPSKSKLTTKSDILKQLVWLPWLHCCSAVTAVSLLHVSILQQLGTWLSQLDSGNGTIRFIKLLFTPCNYHIDYFNPSLILFLAAVVSTSTQVFLSVFPIYTMPHWLVWERKTGFFMCFIFLFLTELTLKHLREYHLGVQMKASKYYVLSCSKIKTIVIFCPCFFFTCI